MTAQFSDSVQYRDHLYSLAGVKGQPLFDPLDHGLVPRACSTALWRGFLCLYEIHDHQLYLKKLSLCLDGEPATLLGVPAQRGEDSPGFDAVYPELKLKIPFTGGLLLARDFIQELYVHMGFHPAWKFREVHELVFDQGELLSENDRSKDIAQIRERFGSQSADLSPYTDQESLGKWIEDSFKLDYDYWDT